MEKSIVSQEPFLLHQIFEIQAAKTPDNVAVEHPNTGQRLTYAKLNHCANRLAGVLQDQGVRPGCIVGIYLPRGVEQYIAMLAVLKAGGAYLPVDTELPLQRVAFMFKDSCTRLVLTTNDLWRHDFGESYSPVFVDSVSADETTAFLCMETSSESAAADDDLCYVIYTSGTTGDPKGVCISHRNAVTFVNAIMEVYGARTEDRVLQGFSTAFDASVEEIWLAFSVGATLVVGTLECMRNLDELPAQLDKLKISVFSTVPTLLRTIPRSDLPNLRLLLVGGEAVTSDIVQKWANPQRKFFNGYGPTECTVVTTYAWCSVNREVTIGKPLPGYGVLVLDDDLQEVANGTPGELCVFGSGVSSRGYLNRPKLTSKKFIFHDGCRLYRTGDRVYRNSNGELVYCGRIDSQIKIRGFRVELEEIEAELNRLHGVDGAVVGLCQDSGDPYLVAYIQQEAPRLFDVRQAKQLIRSRLPEYMIPTQFVSLESAAVPKSSSGKIDRFRLPLPSACRSLGDSDPTGEEPEATGGDVAGTPVMLKLLSIWQAILQQPVRFDDSFFELGGHSIMAARIISRCRQDSQLSLLSIRDLYERKTIRNLAVRLEEARPFFRDAPDHIRSTEGDQEKQDLAIETNLSLGQRRAPRVSTFVYGLVVCLQTSVLISLAAAIACLEYGAFLLVPLVSEWSAHQIWNSIALLFVFLPIAGFLLGLLLTVLVKRVVFGPFREKDVPLWSLGYFRWWLSKFFLGPIQTLAASLVGTPLAPPLYRLLGARIGAGVYLGSSLAEPDLITIEDGASIGADVSLRSHFIEEGYLKFRRIYIGRNAFVGPHSIVCGSVQMGEGSRLHPLSCLVKGTRTPPGTEWRGSPATEVAGNVMAMSRLLNEAEALSHKGDAWNTWKSCLRIGVLQVFYLYLLEVAMLFPFVLEGFLLLNVDWLHSAVLTLNLRILLPATVLFSGLRFCLTLGIIIGMKWLITGRARSGTIRLNSLEYVRRWFTGQLMSFLMSPGGTRGITETVFMPWVCWALGMRIGKGTESSEATGFQPDLVQIGDYSTLADECGIGTPIVHCGRMTLAPTVIGNHAFVGNGSHVPLTTKKVEDNCIVGVLTIAPDQMDHDSIWLGSPAVRLPRRRDVSAPANRTTHPPKHLVAARVFWNFWKMILPGALVEMVMWITIVGTVYAFSVLSLAGLAIVLPLLVLAGSFAMLALPVLAKWLLVWRHRPGKRMLWSAWMWRYEVAYEIEVLIREGYFAPLLSGTPYMPLWYRAMGARIGRRACLIDDAFLMETDLICIGDHVALEGFLQTHLFEDRVMELGRIVIQDNCCIGRQGCVLVDSEMRANSSLGDLSLIMRNETFPENGTYRGLPAESVLRSHL